MLGESYENAAAICNCALGTVKSRVNRARRMVMDDLLSQRGAVRPAPPAPRGGSAARENTDAATG
jgi:hypothetical protein